tara:strand:+ start:960 stop:1205 length:246 start_codon:yes stop_codon:yes gene_type:complete
MKVRKVTHLYRVDRDAGTGCSGIGPLGSKAPNLNTWDFACRNDYKVRFRLRTIEAILHLQEEEPMKKKRVIEVTTRWQKML